MVAYDYNRLYYKMSNPYVNYQYLLYPNQQINMNYPSLTQQEETNATT